MADSPKPVFVTAEFLNEEFVKNNWALRLENCASERKDKITEYGEGEKEYHTKIVSRHYENKVQIAITVTYEYFAGNSNTKKWMLLINDVPHIRP